MSRISRAELSLTAFVLLIAAGLLLGERLLAPLAPPTAPEPERPVVPRTGPHSIDRW
jgi:hypothetical protein